MPVTDYIKNWTPRNIKWRFFCATCGELLPSAPSTWAYCSKVHERARTIGGIEEAEMTEKAVEQHLSLSAVLEGNIPSDQRTSIMAQLRELEGHTEVRRRSRKLNPPSMSQDRAEFWINPINREMLKYEGLLTRSVQAAIKMGKMLLDAKKIAGHGQFSRLFHDHHDAVDGAMRFSRNWGTRLMKISAHPVTGDPENGQSWPPNVDLISKMASVDPVKLSMAIKTGAIHKRMTKAEVDALVKDLR